MPAFQRWLRASCAEGNAPLGRMAVSHPHGRTMKSDLVDPDQVVSLHSAIAVFAESSPFKPMYACPTGSGRFGNGPGAGGAKCCTSMPPRIGGVCIARMII